MKKKVYTVLFISFGAGLWISLSTTAHRSIKQWDGKFAAVTRQSLSELGLTNEDILSSTSETKGPANRSWATQTMELKKVTPAQADLLRTSLEEAGARVEDCSSSGKRTFLVKRGNHIYQKITFPVP